MGSENMNQGKIGHFIQECRKQKGLTQEQVGEHLGVSYKTVSKWENGRSLPNPSLYKPLCELLDINLIELFEGERINQEDIVEKTDQVIQDLVEDNHKKSIYQSLILILSWFFMVVGIVVLFIPSLKQFEMPYSLLWICAGLTLLFLGMSAKLVVWGKIHQKKIKNEGMGFCSALTLILITLKLTGYITWSWIWVFSPMWLAVLLFIGIVCVFLVFIKIDEYRKGKKEV